MSTELNDWIVPKRNAEGKPFYETGCQWAIGEIDPSGGQGSSVSLVPWRPELTGDMKSDVILARPYEGRIPAGIYVVEFDFYNTGAAMDFSNVLNMDYEDWDLLWGQRAPASPDLRNYLLWTRPHRAFAVVRANRDTTSEINRGRGGSFAPKNVLMYKIADVDGKREPIRKFGDFKYRYDGYKNQLFYRGTRASGANITASYEQTFDCGVRAFAPYPYADAISTNEYHIDSRTKAPAGIYHCATFASWGMNDVNNRGHYVSSFLVTDLESRSYSEDGSSTPIDPDVVRYDPPRSGGKGQFTHLVRRFGSNINPENYTRPVSNIYDGEWENPVSGGHPTFEGYLVRLSASDLGSDLRTFSFNNYGHNYNPPYIVEQYQSGSFGSLWGGFFAAQGVKGFIRVINVGNTDLANAANRLEFFSGGDSLGFLDGNALSMVFVTDNRYINQGLSISYQGIGNLVGLELEIVYV